MRRKPNYYAGMRSRRERDGTRTFFMVQPDGKKLLLGKDFRLAGLRWVEVQQSRVMQAHPSTALGLLDAFEQCLLPSPSEQAAVRMNAELAILRRFFDDCGDPHLEAITNESAFLTWYVLGKHATSPDSVIRMFRHVWNFALQLEISEAGCPWRPFDLSKTRLQLEAIDVVCSFAATPLRDLLEELLRNTGATIFEQQLNLGEPSNIKVLQFQLKEAVSTAVTRLRSCGRFDLVPPVYQLTVDDLLALRGSPTLALTRPPGRILLEHRRTEKLDSLKSRKKASGDELKTHQSQEHNGTARAGDVVNLVAPGDVPEEGR